MNGNGLPVVEGFDFGYAMGIFQDEEILKIILNDFYMEMDEICAKLNELFMRISNEESLSLYRMEVHALKSTSASIGALLISEQAKILEKAAIDKDIESINLKHPLLIKDMFAHKERLAGII